MKFKIDIVSDVVCPWCYVGENNLEKAIVQTSDQHEFTISFKPYELNPDIPEKGLNRMEHMVNKFGSEERVKAMDLHMRKHAASHGLAYNPELEIMAPNTFNAHRLIWLAEKYNVQKAVATRLFKANFVDGAFVGDTDTLIQIGFENQIPKEELDAFFNSDKGVKEVRELENYYQTMGITGVPAFIINDKYCISGAQPSEAFVEAFKQIAEK